MPPRYPIPAQETRAETRVMNSRFVCVVGEARTVADAQAFVKHVKAEHASASSHAFAFRAGFGASVTDGCNDGGEPSGTAGRPMLAVLQGSGSGDVVAVVSRWFGGTKLGTGGLSRAFSGALKEALAQLPRAERVELKSYELSVPYAMYERVKLLVAAHHGNASDETFGADVRLELAFAADDAPNFARDLRELSGGSLKMTEA